MAARRRGKARSGIPAYVPKVRSLRDAMRDLVPTLPRGIVAQRHADEEGAHDKLGYLMHGVRSRPNFVAYYVMRWRRDDCERDVANAFPDKSARERTQIIRRAYRNLADTLVEVAAGRTAYLAGRMPRREVAVPSSPLRGMLD